MLFGRRGGRSGCSRIVGQIASQAGQLLVSARGLGKAGALAELLERQPALADPVTQQRDAALALGIGGAGRLTGRSQWRDDSFVGVSRRPATVLVVEFSRELRDDVLAGDITLSVRLWKRPRVKQGGRYRVGLGEIEVDAIDLVPFAAITGEDVRRAGEPDRETLRERAAHAGPVDQDTLVYRIEFHAVTPGE